MIRTTIGAVLAALVCWGSADAQTADRYPAFEVASVKPAPPVVAGMDCSMRGGPGTDDPGQITYPCTWVRTLMTMAYGVAFDQISGGPDWLETQAYSIVAKIPPNTTKDQFHLMLQNLLAERFHLTLHHETREFQIYSLLVAKDGPKMKPSPPDADAKTAPPAGPDQHGLDSKGFPVLRPGARIATLQGYGPLYGMLRSAHRETVAQFAEHLGPWVNMSNGDGIVRGSPPAPHVIDKTGLTGEFDFTLEFAGSVFPASSTEASGAGDGRWDGPTLFVALEKQLGLKLEKGKAGLDVLVIDHVDKVPTEN
jgi:uncharacterized protein (TIGR03435 family)